MNPLEVAWYVLKASEEPSQYLNDILSNTDVWQLEHEYAQEDPTFQTGDYISQLIGNVMKLVGQEHDEHPHIVDSVLDTRIFEPDWEHGPDDESHISPDMREAMKESFHKFMEHSPLDTYHSSNYATHSSNQWDDDDDDEDGYWDEDDEDWTPHRADWDSHHGDERGDPPMAGGERTMTERGMDRYERRTGEPVPHDGIRGLAAPLTAGSQGEGRVGPDVMDERQLMRYEAPQLREMIQSISEELTRRGHGDRYRGVNE